MAEQIKQALITFLRAECEQRPVLLVIDDLQWCDSPTVQALECGVSCAGRSAVCRAGPGAAGGR